MDQEIKRVLYVSQKPIAPVVDGGTQAMSLFFEALQACQHLEIVYAPLVTQKHANVDVPQNFNRENIHPLAISTRITPAKLLRSLSKTPFNVIRHSDELARRKMEALIADQDFQWIVCDGFYALTLLPLWVFQKFKVIYRSHNLEMNYWSLRALHEPPWKRILFSWIARAMKRYEQELVASSYHVLSISYEEVNELQRWNQYTSVFLPSASPYAGIQNPLPSQRSIGFVGDMGWFPNRKAMRYFIDNLWPTLRQKIPDVQLALAGKGTESFTQVGQGIQGFGFVDDLAKFYAAQHFLINPIRFGTGFNMKLLEAINFRKPVVTYASRVYGFEDVSCFLAAANDQDFIALTETLLNQPDVAKELGESINSVIDHHFCFKDKVQKLEKMLHE